LKPFADQLCPGLVFPVPCMPCADKKAGAKSERSKEATNSARRPPVASAATAVADAPAAAKGGGGFIRPDLVQHQISHPFLVIFCLFATLQCIVFLFASLLRPFLLSSQVPILRPSARATFPQLFSYSSSTVFGGAVARAQRKAETRGTRRYRKQAPTSRLG
jgi:hypothetical protein